jgi:membrane protease YdiL (CAAX protease family)
MLPEPETGETSAEPAALPPPAPNQRALWLEVAAVFFIGVLPPLWSTAESFLRSQPAAPFDLARIHSLYRSFQVSWLVLYLMARSGTPWPRFGLVAPNWLKDSFVAFGAVITGFISHAAYVAAATSIFSAEALSNRSTHEHPRGPEQVLLMIVSCCANGFAEELVMRGYFIPRLEDLLGSTTKAILISSALFGAYHLYQGPYGAGSALVFGLLFGALFCSVRRLWPLAVAHAITDILIYLR